MADLGLKTFNKLYPMMIRKYQDLIVDQNATEKDKINQIIQKLNALGKLSNDVVRDWNTVYQWAMNDGLATDVNNKIEALRTSGELNTILQSVFNALTGDMTTLHTTAKDTTVNAINEVDDLAKQLQTNQGDLTQLQTTDKDSLVHAINDNVAQLAQKVSQTDFDNRKASKTPLNFGGTCNGSTSDDTAINSLFSYCNTNKIKAVLPNGTVITSVIDIPVGVNVEIQGQIIFSGSGTLRANGNNTISNGSILNSSGNYQGIMLYGQNIIIDNISITCSSGRFGISGLFTTVNGHNCVIKNCKIDTCQYGILIQGATGYGYNNLKIHNNKITNVILGDAIELNIGDSTGVEIYENTIDTVTAQGSAGMGIGVAGKQPYSDTAVYTMKNVSIHDNTVSNVDTAYAVGNAAIHLECVEGGRVYNNRVFTSVRGIESFGCHDIEVYNNYILDCRDGIEHALGMNSGSFVMSAKNNSIHDNRISNTTMITNSFGIHNYCEGDGYTARTQRNIIKNIATGIYIRGASNHLLDANECYGCTTPYTIDYAWYLKPVTTNTTLNVTRNRVFNSTDGTRNTASVTYLNMFYIKESFYEGNDFNRYTSSAVATANNGTITTTSVSVARISPTSAITGVILQAGAINGQEVTVINEATSANSITFASTGSNVADGSSTVISGGTARKFVWDSGTSLWYRIQ